VRGKGRKGGGKGRRRKRKGRGRKGDCLLFISLLAMGLNM